MRLVGEVYWWWENNNIDYWDWFVLHEFLRTWYVPLHASEADCEEHNVEHEPELEKPQCSDLIIECKELLADVGKILENMVTKSADPEPPALAETVIVDESESEVEEPGP